MKLSFKYFLHDFLRVTGAIPGVIFYRPKILYENENAKKRIKGGALVVANHVGVLDPLHLMFGIWYRRHHFVAMKELFESSKFNGFLFRHAFLCIPIDREKFSLKTFKEIVGHLRSGDLVTMFPEGRVNDEDSGFGDFKSGMILMALKGNVPIVPVYSARKTRFFERLKFVIGEPIDLNALKSALGCDGKNFDEMTEYIREKEKSLEEIYLKKYKPKGKKDVNAEKR